MTTPHLRMTTLLVAAILLLTGCISIGPRPGSHPKGVTISGTVRTSVVPSVMTTASQPSAQAGQVPVTVLRVTAHGELEPLGIFGTTDEEGRFTLSGVPDRTHVVVKADVPTQSGEMEKSITLLSTAVTQGNTQVDVDPLHHVAYEVIRKYAEVSFGIWKLVVPLDGMQQIIAVTTDIFMSDILPQVGPPPDIASWDEPMACDGISYGEPPMVTTLACYMAHVDQTIIMSPALVQRVNDILEPHIPSKKLHSVAAGTVNVDGKPDDWADIAPVTIGSGVSKGSGSDQVVELKAMYLAGDGEYMNVLVQFDTEGAPAD